ncbi:IS110 family RNA-guided transposase [Nocardia tengchongensis]|uniref:IS110 family transposase n=1 Tax=Nocardia tengchongensis TaxID=2055889 RepID=UPI0036B56767
MTVIIGMDPHKRSATIEIIDHTGKKLAVGRYSTDKSGYTEMLTAGKRFTDRIWAVEGCSGIGRHLAHRLVHDGETVLDVPAKLSAQVRVFATGNGRKTDPVDAHSVAMAALYSPNLLRVEPDPDLLLLGMLADRRDELGRTRTETVNRLHRFLLDLFPGGAKKFLSAKQARTLIATVKPRDALGKTRRRLAVELISDLESIDRKINAADKELQQLVIDRGSTLMDLHGIGPSSAARRLADTGDIHRFRNRDRFASWNGTAPLDASSGDQQRHRLSRAGNRRKAAGKTSMESMRSLKRRLSNVLYTRMLADQRRRETASPGGHSGTTLTSSATGLTPHTDPSEKPLPGPATNQANPTPTAVS